MHSAEERILKYFQTRLDLKSHH